MRAINRSIWLIVGMIAVSILALYILKISAYRVDSGSMNPDFPVGTLVIVSGVAPIEPHQAITFNADGKTVTHVLVGYNPDGSLVTRGIANSTQDVWRASVYPKDVHGRVILRFLLFAPSFWQSLKGGVVMVGLCLALLAFYLWRRSNRIRFRRRYA